MAVGPSWTREGHSGARRAREGPTAFRRRGPDVVGQPPLCRRRRRRRLSLKLGTKRGEIELAHRRSPHALPPFLALPLCLSYVPRASCRRRSEELFGRRRRRAARESSFVPLEGSSSPSFIVSSEKTAVETRLKYFQEKSSYFCSICFILFCAFNLFSM